MGVPCRCSKRTCRARRTLRKHPDLYKREPRCHFNNCRAPMRPDRARIEGKERETLPVCHRDCYPYPHRVNTDGCKSREDWVIERAFNETNQMGAKDDEPPF